MATTANWKETIISATQDATRTDQVTTKSDNGLSDGVVSELVAFFTAKPRGGAARGGATVRRARHLS